MAKMKLGKGHGAAKALKDPPNAEKMTKPKFKIKKGHNVAMKETEKHIQAVATFGNHNL